MELIEIKCKNCGAKIKLPDDANKVTCEFCGTEYAIDRATVVGARELGYEFEKGRIQAVEEAMAPPPKKHYLLKALGWLCVYPVMITYYSVKGERMSKLPLWLKIFINAAGYVSFFMLAYSA